MSKRLPYFQFEPAAYFAKDIQLCSLAAQGLFMNICAIYWQRECRLTLTQINKRFNHPELIQELIEERVINICDDIVEISFLDKQYQNAMGISNERSIAGQKSAEIKRIRKEIMTRLEFIAEQTNTSIDDLQQEFNINSTNVDFLLQQNSTIKIKEKKIKEDNINKKEINKEKKQQKTEFVNQSEILLRLYDDNQTFSSYVHQSRQLLRKNAKQMNKQDWVTSYKMSISQFKTMISQMNKQYGSYEDISKHFINWCAKFPDKHLSPDYFKI